MDRLTLNQRFFLEQSLKWTISFFSQLCSQIGSVVLTPGDQGWALLPADTVQGQNIHVFTQGGGGVLQPGGWCSHAGDQRQLVVWHILSLGVWSGGSSQAAPVSLLEPR